MRVILGALGGVGREKTFQKSAVFFGFLHYFAESSRKFAKREAKQGAFLRWFGKRDIFLLPFRGMSSVGLGEREVEQVNPGAPGFRFAQQRGAGSAGDFG